MAVDFRGHPMFAPGFNGDGHISAFRFATGSVDFKARYVKTDRLMAERRARKRLWGVYPRSSEPIGYGRPHGDGELVAAVHPADLQFLA
jgi:carotenoid cleavage dioxygenase-like enzyme